MDSSGEVLDCGSLMNRQEVVSKPLLEMAVHQVLIHRPDTGILLVRQKLSPGLLIRIAAREMLSGL
jgi:hypothetical protein